MEYNRGGISEIHPANCQLTAPDVAAMAMIRNNAVWIHGLIKHCLRSWTAARTNFAISTLVFAKWQSRPPRENMSTTSDVACSAMHVKHYSIRVPGWVLKCLNLITAPGSVSNQPGSVTWLATAGISKIHAVSWRNHIEIKLQRELRICNLGLKSTLYLHISLFPYLFARKRLSNSSLTVVWQLSNSWPN